jgi:hypothetical protein
MKSPMAASRPATEVKVPRMAWRVMMPKKISTMFSQEQLVEVKCRLIRGFLASHLRMFSWVWVLIPEHCPCASCLV